MNNRRKKIISIFISFVVMLGYLITVPFCVNAEQDESIQDMESVKFTVSSAFSKSGGKAKIFVDISENSQVSAVLFKLNFDKTMLRAGNVNIGVVLKDGYTSKNINDNGQVIISYADTKPIYDGGRVFEAEFEVIGAIPEGEKFCHVPIELEIADIRDYNDNIISAVAENGRITVINAPYGDLNGEDGTTPTDALITLNAASQLIELTNEQFTLADVNGDLKITPADALAILQYSAGYISNYPIFTIAPPNNLHVSEKSENYLTISWDPIEIGVLGYDIYRDEIKINEEPINATSYTINGLEQDTQYTFNVCAVNSLLSSDKSKSLTVSTNKADRTVIFKDWDGTILDTQIVLSGENAIAPSIPSRTGYTFTGWDLSLENIVEDTIITAVYKINNYTVTFDSCGGSEVNLQNADYGTKITKPVNPKREDYTFVGWFRDSAYVKEWDFENDIVEKNVTFYAKWVTWGEWTTDNSLADNELYETEQKTQYAYSDKSTTSSSEPALSGWTQYDKKITSYTNWSAWQNTYVASSSSRQVETRYINPTYKTQYNYSRRRNGNTVGPWEATWGGVWCSVYEEYGWIDSPLTYTGTQWGYGTQFACYRDYRGGSWYNQVTRNVVVTNGYTQYRYRDGKYTYYYYKWSAYSQWQDKEYIESDTRKVISRVVYRYKLKEK